MDPLMEARNYALNIAPGTALFHYAYAVCRLRLIEPNGVHMSCGLLNWQAVIMEQAVLKQLDREIRI